MFVVLYAGVPLRIDGQAIGTFCLMDTAPRAGFSDGDRQRLSAKCGIVEHPRLRRRRNYPTGEHVHR